jgi:hypothetical protein
MNRIARSLIPLAMALLTACGGGGDVSPGYSASPVPPPPAGAALWPPPSDPMSLARQAGLIPGTHEFFTYHVHAHLDVLVNGQQVRVPGGSASTSPTQESIGGESTALRATGTSSAVPGRASRRCIPTT